MPLPPLRGPLLALALAAPAALPAQEAGPYLAAQAAVAARDFAAAAPLLDQALAASPDNRALLEPALAGALALGDGAAAAAYADRLAAGGQPSALAGLARLLARADAGDWTGVLALLDAKEGAGPLVDGLARGWAAWGAGDAEGALAAFRDLGGSPGLQAFGLLHEALALALAGDGEGALAALARPEASGIAASLPALRLRAQVLGQLDRTAEARALLDEAAPNEPQLAALRAALEAGPVPFDVVRGPEGGLALALTQIGAALGPDADPLTALLYARAALLLDPARADAAVMAAETLEALGAPDLARAAFALVPAGDPLFPRAEIGRARVLAAGGEGEAAAEALLALARAHPGLPEVESALADQLRLLDRLPEAEAAYGRALDLLGGGSWRLLFRRALVRQEAGDWPGTEADLRAALLLAPDEPRLLNHLGYSLVERREKLPEALAMIERAVAAEPTSGAIVDSLGWAYWRLGRFEEAVAELERAAALEPTDPVINDHLGDAYWSVGRTREARFQWTRALSLDPEEADAARIRDKLARGLDAVLAEEAEAPPETPLTAAGQGGPGGG